MKGKESGPGQVARSSTRGSQILGADYELPKQVLTNDQLHSEHPEWRMDEVTRHTGVRARRVAASEETALDLGERAARKLLSRLDFPVSSIEGLLFCTQTPDFIMPPNACLLQHQLGVPKSAMAFDFSLACSGYVYGLFLANSLISSGALENVLLINADTYSKLIFPGDRGTRTLFGDGAAATLVTAGSDAIGPFDLGTDGERASGFNVPAGGARQPKSDETAIITIDKYGNRNTLECLHMDGAAVLEFVLAEVPGSVKRVLAAAELSIGDLDLVIFHQASKLSIDYLTRALKIPREKVFVNIGEIGNTVSASIPIALRDAEVKQVLRRGQRCLLAGFGVGMSWGACIIEWQ